MSKVSQQIINKILSFKAKGKIHVAFSGGLDSAVLLHAVVSNKTKFSEDKIVAVHVDHGLQEVSSVWAQQCKQIALAYGIDFKLIQLQVKKGKGESIELAARNARYYEFEQLLGPEDVMLFAHHADDQVETFLQQALRGAGVQGLGGIPESRKLGKGFLLRPLLDISRNELNQYADSNNLQWIEDPTNSQNDFDRNLLRNDIIPLLEKRWPGAKKGLLRSLSHCREASKQIDEATDVILADIEDENRLAVSKLAELTVIQQKNLIRRWVRNNHIVLPNANRLESGMGALINAAYDKNPVLDWDFGIIRRFQDQLYINPLPEKDFRTVECWDINVKASIADGICLEAKNGSGIGLKKDGLDLVSISIRYRQGGERCRPFGREGAHELKKLFQEYKIPTWLRDKVPLVYIENEIAAVIGCCYCEPFAERGDGVVKIVQVQE